MAEQQIEKRFDPATMPKYERVTFNKGRPEEFSTQMPTAAYADHLRTTFRLVGAKMKNWKCRINVRLDLSKEEVADLSEAISFICGSPSEFEPILGGKKGKCRYHITAPGYYNCIGA